METETVIGGSIADIGAGIVTTTGIRDAVAAKIPDLAAHDDVITIETMIQNLENAATATEKDDVITQKTEIPHLVAEETHHKSARQGRMEMIHTETVMVAANADTDTLILMEEETVRAGARRQTHAPTRSAMTLGKKSNERKNRHGSWLLCSRLHPSLTRTERHDWQLSRNENVPPESPTTKLGSGEEIEASSMVCIGKQ